MSKRTIYIDDETKNGLEFYLNDQKEVFFQCGILEGEDSPYYSGWVCLSKSDIEEIIKDLQDILPSM